MKPTLRSFAPSLSLLLALSLLPAALTAQTTLSFTGTANGTSLGFTSGQSATFTFTINGSYAGGSQDYFDSAQNQWQGDIPAGPSIFTQFGGTGTTGSLTPFTNPSSYAYAYNSSLSPAMEMLIWGNGGEDLGVSLGGNLITNVQLGLNMSGVDFEYLGPYPDPAGYFASFSGTYVTPDIEGSLTIITDGGSNSFALTSYSIASAIPEPSTYALLTGLGTLGLAMLRRRLVAPTRLAKMQ